MDVKSLPSELNLGSHKSTTVEAYVKEVRCFGTNAQSYGPNQTANITLDTSTPGAFLDTKQCCLEFDITLSNTNPYIDYINLSYGGLANVIDTFQIYSMGTPLEEIFNYNLVFDHFMKLSDASQLEFKMYLENSWRPPVAPGKSHLNFVKPPMVDTEGLVMHPNLFNTFADPNPFAWKTETGGYCMNYSTPDPKFAGSIANSTTFGAKDLNTFGINSAPHDTAAGNFGLYPGMSRRPDDYITTSLRGDGNVRQVWDNTFTKYAEVIDANGKFMPSAASSAWNYRHIWAPWDTSNCESSAPGNVRTQTFSRWLVNSYVTWPDTLPPESLLLSEVRQQQEKNFKGARYQDYMYFLSNTKNIPIGIKPSKTFIKDDLALATPDVRVSPDLQGAHDANVLCATSRAGHPKIDPYTQNSYQGSNMTDMSHWNLDVLAKVSSQTQTTKFHVVLPIMSGIIGTYAEKMFPTMLMAPSTMYVALRFTQPEILFQCAMDPCRRIHGTYRDYVPNCGLSTMYATEFRGQVLGPSLSEIIPACNGTNHSYMAITTAAAEGNDFAWQGVFAAPGGKPIDSYDVVAHPPLVDGTKDNGYRVDTVNLTTIYDATQSFNTGNAYRCNLVSFAQSDECLYGGFRAGAVEALVNPLTDALRATIGPNGNVMGIAEGFTTGLAKPQYVPRPTPWLYGGNGFSDAAIAAGYCLESRVCYGTYLPFSTAQVRRILPDTNKYCSYADQDAGAHPTYQIDGLQLVYQQVVLPDAVTSSIVQAAAHQSISLDAQSVSTYRTVCALSEFQSLLFPVKLASVNGVWVYFHNMRTQNIQEALYYNSFAGICPFSSFTWNPDNTIYQSNTDLAAEPYFVGSFKPPTYNGLLTNGGYSYQFRIGSELFPMVPVNNIDTCIKELVRSVHGAGDMRCCLPFQASFRHARYADNQRANPANTKGQSEHTGLRSGQYTVPFIPVEALDDQTITDNIAFADYYASCGNSLGAGTQTAKQKPAWYQLRGNYLLADFLPPESSFVIGCDFDTFPGQGQAARSGRYIGTSPITLVMTDTKGLNNKSDSSRTQQDSVIATLIALHDIRLDFTAGGNCLAFK